MSQFFSTTISGWDLLWALLAVVIGWILSRVSKKTTLSLVHRVPGISDGLALFAARVAQYMTLLLGIGIALAFLGANVQPLIAVALIVAVIGVLILRGVADNFAASILIQTRHPVTLGDEITVDSPIGAVTGVITGLDGRTVTMLTYDGSTVHVPNTKLLDDPIVNNSTRGARRTEVQVRVGRDGRGVDELVTAIAEAAALPGVNAEPRPRALVVSVTPERLTARVQFWHDPLDGVTVTASVVQGIASALEASGLAATVTSERPVPPLVPPDGV